MTDYKLVPVVPTAEMVEAATEAFHLSSSISSIVRAALAVAPAVQGEPVSHDWDDQDKCRRCGDRDWYASATCTPKQQPAPDVAGLVQQHHRDSAELRRLCQARDEQRDGRLAALERAAKAEADVAGLVEALELFASNPIPTSDDFDKARAALAAHRNQEPSHDNQ